MRYPVLNALPLLLAAMLLLSGCASSQNAMRAVSGTWSYTVYETSEGDVDGELRLAAPGGSLSGEITSELADQPAPLEQISLEGQTLSFSAAIDIDGEVYETATTATLSGDSMEGTMDVAGEGTYRFAATRAGS